MSRTAPTLSSGNNIVNLHSNGILINWGWKSFPTRRGTIASWRSAKLTRASSLFAKQKRKPESLWYATWIFKINGQSHLFPCKKSEISFQIWIDFYFPSKIANWVAAILCFVQKLTSFTNSTWTLSTIWAKDSRKWDNIDHLGPSSPIWYLLGLNCKVPHFYLSRKYRLNNNQDLLFHKIGTAWMKSETGNG